MKRCRVFIRSLLLLVLAGCAAPQPGAPQSGVEAFVSRQLAAAGRLEQQGQLHQALVHLRTAAYFRADDSALTQRMRQLRQTIAQRVAAALQEGKRSLAQNDSKRANLAFLRVLALEPNQPLALSQLRRMETRRVIARQAQKSDAENEARVLLQTGVTDDVLQQLQALLDAEKYQTLLQRAQRYPRGDGHPQFKAIKIAALRQLAALAERNGQTEQAVEYLLQAQSLAGDTKEITGQLMLLKTKLSDRWVAEGVRLIGRDPDTAVQKLQQAVQYNPDNVLAQKHLQRAMKLQANLQKLRQRSAN